LKLKIKHQNLETPADYQVLNARADFVLNSILGVPVVAGIGANRKAPVVFAARTGMLA
jgi:hypothetical protein